MARQNELDILRRFDSGGHLTLSVYLDLSNAEKHDQVMEDVQRELEPLFLHGNEADSERLQELQEDLDMVRLYFSTSGSRRSPYIAIFSCAPMLFWRVYRLDTPVRELVDVGPRFNLRPLEESLRRLEAKEDGNRYQQYVALFNKQPATI